MASYQRTWTLSFRYGHAQLPIGACDSGLSVSPNNKRAIAIFRDLIAELSDLVAAELNDVGLGAFRLRPLVYHHYLPRNRYLCPDMQRYLSTTSGLEMDTSCNVFVFVKSRQ